jgi:hypothetical protein
MNQFKCEAFSLMSQRIWASQQLGVMACKGRDSHSTVSGTIEPPCALRTPSGKLFGVRGTRCKSIFLKRRKMKTVIFWDVAPCRYFVNRRWFIARGFLIPWRWRRCVPPKRRFTQYLYDATSQKTVFFIVTDVITSDLGVKWSNMSEYGSFLWNIRKWKRSKTVI